MNQSRQGDVFLIKVKQVPSVARAIGSPTNEVTLAEGEATGHKHVLVTTRHQIQWYETKEPVDVAGYSNLQATEFVEVKEAAVQIHTKHGPFVVEPDIYAVGHQRVYTPQEIRRTID